MEVSWRPDVLSVRRFVKGGLRARVTHGGAWLGSGSAAEQVGRLARNLILTRMLAPGAFGTMAIVLSLSSLVGSMTDVGLFPAVIQHPDGGKDNYLNAAWWIGVARALLVYALIFASAPWLSQFYGDHEISGLLRLTLLSTVFDGLLSPRSKLAQKELIFSRWVLLSNGGALCGVLLTIVLTFVIRNVWALAIGYCAENVFRCVFSFALCPGLPSIRWDKRAFKELWEFSKGMVGLSFLNLVFARADVFVLGKMLPPAALGIYTMGVFLIQTPSNFLINIIGTTLLPAVAQVQADRQRVNRIISEAACWITLVGLPAVAMVCLCGASLLTVSYGARYAAATGPVALAAGVALLNTLNSLLTTLFFAFGRPALHRRAVATSAVVMLIVTYPSCHRFGSAGGQLSALIAIAASYAIQVTRAREITGLSIFHFARGILPAAIVSAGMFLAGAAAHYFGLTGNPFANIGISAAACIIVSIICMPIFARLRELPFGTDTNPP